MLRTTWYLLDSMGNAVELTAQVLKHVSKVQCDAFIFPFDVFVAFNIYSHIIYNAW